MADTGLTSPPPPAIISRMASIPHHLHTLPAPCGECPEGDVHPAITVVEYRVPLSGWDTETSYLLHCGTRACRDRAIAHAETVGTDVDEYPATISDLEFVTGNLIGATA